MKENNPGLPTPLDDYPHLTATQTTLLRALTRCKKKGEDLCINRINAYLKRFPQPEPEDFADSLFEIEQVLNVDN